MLKRTSIAALTAFALAALTPASADAAEVAPEGEVPAFNASMSPEQLARNKPSAISLRLEFKVPPKEGKIPELNAIRFGISRRVSFNYGGLPACSLQTLFSSYAEESCTHSLVGRGSVVSEVTLPGHEPTTVFGVARAYYSFDKKQPRILVRVVTGEPLPLIYVIPFELRSAADPYPTSIGVARMSSMQGICARGHPNCFAQPYRLKGIYSHISEFQLDLHRRFRHRRSKASFVSAECAAAPGQREMTFSLATMDLFYPEQTFTGSQSARCEPKD
jgi:hypothetical protein